MSLTPSIAKFKNMSALWFLFVLPAVLAASYKDKLKDYTCYHSYSWMKNTEASKSSLFSAYTDIYSSGYITNRRRLQSKPPPPSSGPPPPTSGGLPPPPTTGGTGTAPTATPTYLTTGWKVTFSGIPSYVRNITAWDLNLLNNRPNGDTDFTTGSTTVKKGQLVTFGSNIGYTGKIGCDKGYWPPGPDCPSDMSAKYVFPTSPAPETSANGCYASTELGYFVNGVPIWNWADTNSYNSEGVWHNLAMKFEFYDVDMCFGHAAMGEYHHHSYSPCLMDQLGDDGSAHSPIHGFAYDGYPIFGPYQASNTLAVSCWQARDYKSSSATGCSDGSRSCVLKDPYDYTKGSTTTTKVGPSTTTTLTSQSKNTIYVTSGSYYEDFFYNSTCAALGKQYLDHHNGHDHDGIGYHYHLTMDNSGVPTFPYSVGPKYYGCLPSGSQSCGTSYLYGSTIFGVDSYSKGTSTCGTTSAVSSTCTGDSWTLGTLPPTKTPTQRPTKSPSIASPTRSPIVTKTPTAVPSTFSPTKAPNGGGFTYDEDYTCYHAYSWMENVNQNYASAFTSYTDVSSSQYIQDGNRRRLQLPPPPSGSGTLPPPPSGSGTPPPPSSGPMPPSNMPPPPDGGSGGGSGPPPDTGTTTETVYLTTGWKVTFSGIPSYVRNITAWDLSLLNSRPNKASDFTTGSTTVKKGDLVTFGSNIGYKYYSGCDKGYWPKGPDCPEDMNAKYVFPVDPAPENSTAGCYASTELGYFVNGVPIWNWADTTSYKSEDTWHNLAMKFEFYDVDMCFGHAAMGEYHHHSYSPCLMDQLEDDGTDHSPIHGFAYDGYPIFGPYQDEDTLAVSCWQARDYSSTSETGCSNGQRSCVLKDPYDYTKGSTTTTKVGPLLNSTVTSQSKNTIYVTSGSYFEDFFFNSSCAALGKQYLDHHNGHDHDGIGYHYHLTMDNSGVPTFPYSFGPKYYGCLQGGSQACGISYLYGANIRGIDVYAKGVSTCAATSASSARRCAGYKFTAKVPTAAPTDAPYINPPTRLPTLSPTSAAPSIAPTVQVAAMVSFDSTLSMSGLTSTTLDETAQQAIIDGAAQAMSIDGSNIEITEVTVSSLRRRNLLQLTTTYTATVDLTVTVNTVDYSSADASFVYNSLKSDLESSVSSGTLSTYIQDAATSYGVTSLASATASSVSVSSATIVNPPTYAPTSSPGTSVSGFPIGAIIGIAIGGVIVLGCLIAAAYLMCRSGGDKSATAPSYNKVDRNEYPVATAVPADSRVEMRIATQNNTANL